MYRQPALLVAGDGIPDIGMYYFEDEDAYKRRDTPKGLVQLAGATMSMDSVEGVAVLTVHTAERDIALKAENAEVDLSQEWLEPLTKFMEHHNTTAAAAGAAAPAGPAAAGAAAVATPAAPAAAAAAEGTAVAAAPADVAATPAAVPPRPGFRAMAALAKMKAAAHLAPTAATPLPDETSKVWKQARPTPCLPTSPKRTSSNAEGRCALHSSHTMELVMTFSHLNSMTSNPTRGRGLRASVLRRAGLPLEAERRRQDGRRADKAVAGLQAAQVGPKVVRASGRPRRGR